MCLNGVRNVSGKCFFLLFFDKGTIAIDRHISGDRELLAFIY